MASTEDNILEHNFLLGLHEDHDILDEFLDQRVYDSIGTNTPTSNPIKLENDNLLDSMYPSATGNYSNSHSINNSHSNSRFNLNLNGLQESRDNEDVPSFPHLQNNNDYLYVDSNYPDISSNSIYTSPFDPKAGSVSHTSNSSISKEKVSNSSISDYDYVRDELNKLKYGTLNMNPCPDSVNMPDPINYLDFSPQTMANLPYKLQIANLPTYSRVETQIKIKFTLSPPPPHILLHIPQDLISKNKFCLNELIDSLSPKLKENLLFMDAYVLTSDTHKSCNICVRCIKREQRRASRRKANDTEGNNSNNDTTYNTPVANGGVIRNNPNSWADESMKKKAIIFNCKEIVSFPTPTGLNNDLSKSLELSARIICYCRHHKESEGFKLLFVLKDAHGQIVAKQLTSPIMIMDRKKNANSKFEATNSVAGSSTNLKDMNDANMDDDDDEYEHKLSFNKKSISNSDIAKSYALARAPNVTSPHLEIHARNQSQPQQEESVDSDLLSSLHPLSPNSIDESASEPLTNTDTNTTSDMRGTKRKKLSFDDSYNNSTNPMFNGSVSGFSPLSNSDTNTSTTNHLMKHMPNVNPMNSNFGSFSGLSQASGSQQQETLPSIQRIIPAQGSIRGGIEVTLLGFNFRPGLIVKFGANQALATHCWSETTIVTYLPPAAQPGQVLVSFENQEDVLYGAGQQKQIFTYTDDTDRQLIELALQIVGLKMNGKLEDAKNIAKRIVGSDNNNSGSGTSSSTNGMENANIQNTMNQANMDWFDNAHRAVQRLTKSDLSTEDILINFLSLVDLPNCPIIIPNWLLSNKQGQSLMHISTMKNYTNLVKFLITHGCKIDVQDNQGLTPLFLASMCGHRDLIQIFIDCKSNWNLKLANDRYLKDYCDLNVLDIFNKLEIDESDDLIIARDEKLTKTHSLDSLNSMFATSYGRHVSKMVMENSVDVDSSSQVAKAVDRFVVTSQEESNFSSYADSEYESNDYDDLDDDTNSFVDEDDYYEDEADEESVYSQELAAEASGDETVVAGSSDSGAETATGVWQKVKNIFTTDEEDNLPSYDDLFPFGQSSSAKPKTSVERSLNEEVVAPSEESSSSKLQTEDSQDEAGIASDSSEDMVISYINHPRKTVENDKMLIFFWLPALVCILGLFFMVSVMGWRIEFIEKIKIFVRDTIGNMMVGNERIGRVFNTNNCVQRVLDATNQLVN